MSDMIDEIVEQNRKIQDPVFCERFRKEWNEITTTLRQIHEASKISNNGERTNNGNSVRLTSSSMIFK